VSDPVHSIQERLDLAGGPPPKESPHIRWRFWVLSLALAICLIGGFVPWTPPEARSAGFAVASAIVAAMAKPLEGMDP
jgi:hypothetical protein